MKIRGFKKKRVAILGFGEEGQSIARFLQKQNVDFKIIDIRREDQLNQEKVQEFKKKGISFQFNSYPDNFGEFDLVIRSPGISMFSAVIEKIRKQNIEISSSTKVFFDMCPCPIIGVTGTKGKSTTSTLVFEMLKREGEDVYLGGNIGVPPLDFLDALKPDSKVVLELSSFQLQDLDKSPQIAVVLMVTSEHLDYHRDLQNYIDAKRNILRFQSEGDYAILNRDYPASNESDIHTEAKVYNISRERKVDRGCYVQDGAVWLKEDGKETKVIPIEEILLAGRHNLENVCAATMAAWLAGASLKNIGETLKAFRGLPYRLEFIGEHRGVRFYNDSLATVPEATIEAIETLGENVETLIAGGFDRGLDYSELGKYLSKSKVRNLILFPTTGEKIWDIICKEIPNEALRPKKYDAKSMKEAVLLAYEQTNNGKICLLSPAASSFNMFKNYKDRGNQFKHFVIALA
jgi:UDP-N-acetylmuramoylalanine--D-glutamate ligase